MSLVYVVQEQQWRNPATGQYESRFDLSRARVYGDLVHVLSPRASPFQAHECAVEIDRALSRFKAEDFLLLIGNPSLIAMVSAYAAHKTGGQLKLLQWSPRGQTYEPVEVKIF